MDQPLFRPETVEDPNLHKEFFSPEQLVAYAPRFAAAYTIEEGTKSNYLSERLNHNEQILKDYTHRTLLRRKTANLVPASQWLTDNYYLIEEQVLLARNHLPKKYSRGLPSFTDGPYKGLPRVYGLVSEYVGHVDGQVDIASLEAFIDSYQKVTTLKLGELWAIPIMLRLSLIENLGRISVRLRKEEDEREDARRRIDMIKEAAAVRPSDIITTIADMARNDVPVSSAFVSEFSQGLSSQNLLHGVRSWLEQRLSEEGISIEEMLQAQSQTQAADQLSVSNSITSLRGLASIDWRDVVEHLSIVERILRTDPAGTYPLMDFPTRDHYRHQVEALSKYSEHTETDVASRAIALATGNDSNETDNRAGHVGYYLADDGRLKLDRGPWGQIPVAGEIPKGYTLTAVTILLRRDPDPDPAGGHIILYMAGICRHGPGRMENYTSHAGIHILREPVWGRYYELAIAPIDKTRDTAPPRFLARCARQ